MPTLPVAATLIAVRNERNQNQGAAVTDLLIVRLPPGLLRNNGDTVRVAAAFFDAANANAKTDLLLFGSTQIAGISATLNNLPVAIQAWITRRAPGSQSAVAIVDNHGGGALVILTDTITEDEGGSIAISMRVQGVATGDIESRLLQVDYIPVGSTFGF